MKVLMCCGLSQYFFSMKGTFFWMVILIPAVSFVHMVMSLYYFPILPSFPIVLSCWFSVVYSSSEFSWTFLFFSILLPFLLFFSLWGAKVYLRGRFW